MIARLRFGFSTFAIALTCWWPGTAGKAEPSAGAPPAAAPAVRTATWRAAEISFQSAASYSNPLMEADLEVTFTSPSGRVYAVPGFWDGGRTWRVRFAPPESGIWRYVSSCSHAEDSGLHGQHGALDVTPYQGPLEIFRRGFLRTEPGKRYFLYADGTPFFYLGDTHWSMPAEPFDGMFAAIVRKRVAQGFTVYQSEPLRAGYHLADGLSETDLPGLRDLDRRFQAIAAAGLVHANAQLFFPPEIAKPCYAGAYLEKLCRLWVARFAAYPVLWTTAQEVDNDFYFDRGDQRHFDASSNPWKKVLSWVHRFDPYAHPGSAHMEFAGFKPEPAELPPKEKAPRHGFGVLATTSSFREVPGHTWYAMQWTPPNNAGIPWPTVKDFWNQGQGKPVVNYEGSYDHLWTLEEGARQQGWTAFLNGMCGLGYGAIDIWLYQSNYDMNKDSVRGAFTITVAQKRTPWTESVDFPAATQLGVHMRTLLTEVKWWELTPRFDDRTWFTPQASAWYSLATAGPDVCVLYLYNWTSTATGTLNQLRPALYTAQWFNPRTGERTGLGSFQPEAGSWTIPPKPTAADWVLVARCQEPNLKAP